ncbi:hypothetical protein CPE01_25440 [Cellulomonas persica]|uniref:Uncharacterized protein n=1 Tax=Cellulomonas persica TaxID=76861 RepID=A0A510UZ51_9CELL|nr:hypothetical protein CPE01_25440 [Cellulomonas persica]
MGARSGGAGAGLVLGPAGCELVGLVVKVASAIGPPGSGCRAGGLVVGRGYNA